jgi:anhydro-N-acetylmuramic acid kinase
MSQYYIGLMSGTSLDGVDAALVAFDKQGGQLVKTSFVPYPEDLRQQLLALHTPQNNELELSLLVSNQLVTLYAEAASNVLDGNPVHAIGCHGQTIRHRPDLGFTLQLNNPARLAELCGITVVADFRSRDIAAGGQGAPLVPAFHQGVFAHPQITRSILNIGGISNLTYLPVGGAVNGFDSGPGNLLMDAWCQQHTGNLYDKDGAWAASGTAIPVLLEQLNAHPFFKQPLPKSTGRDVFNMAWLQSFLHQNYASVDVQATLLELTARSIADAVNGYCPGTTELYLCGGGAHNLALQQRLIQNLAGVHIALTNQLGIHADWVEAVAFAWLAKQALEGKPGNLPEVTGAKGPRVLGAIYLAA